MYADGNKFLIEFHKVQEWVAVLMSGANTIIQNNLFQFPVLKKFVFL